MAASDGAGYGSATRLTPQQRRLLTDARRHGRITPHDYEGCVKDWPNPYRQMTVDSARAAMNRLVRRGLLEQTGDGGYQPRYVAS